MSSQLISWVSESPFWDLNVTIYDEAYTNSSPGRWLPVPVGTGLWEYKVAGGAGEILKDDVCMIDGLSQYEFAITDSGITIDWVNDSVASVLGETIIA